MCGPSPANVCQLRFALQHTYTGSMQLAKLELLAGGGIKGQAFEVCWVAPRPHPQEQQGSSGITDQFQLLPCLE